MSSGKHCILACDLKIRTVKTLYINGKNLGTFLLSRTIKYAVSEHDVFMFSC